MVGLVAQKRVEDLFSVWLGYCFFAGLDRNKYSIDLRQDVGIIDCEDPATVRLIVGLKDAQTLCRPAGAVVLAPDVETGLQVWPSRVSQIVSIKDQRFAFGIENSAKRSFSLTVFIGIVNINDVKIPSNDQIRGLPRGGRELFTLLKFRIEFHHLLSQIP